MQASSKNTGKLAKKKSGRTVTVYLAKGPKPEVQVDSVIWGRPTIKFVKDVDSEDFDFVSLVFSDPGAPFAKPVRKKAEISVANRGGQGEWHYTIKVEAGGKTYDTSEKGGPGGDRPVIRN